MPRAQRRVTENISQNVGSARWWQRDIHRSCSIAMCCERRDGCGRLQAAMALTSIRRMATERSQEGRAGEWQTLRALLSDIDYALLTTRAADGTLVSRPPQLLQVDTLCTLWFFTSKTSAKVEEIRRDRRVNIAIADPAKKRFCSISGSGEILVDEAKADELWGASQRIFYPHGRDDPSLALVRVTAESAYYWDGNESAWGLLKKFGRAVLLHEPSDLGSSAQLDFGA